jgi:hypothetical protein
VFTTRELKNNPWPPDWYTENPMFPWFHHWTDFTRRASYINSMGSTAPDVLLYNPMETAWIHATGPLMDANGMWTFDESFAGGKRINEVDRVYAAAINDLTDARVEYLVGDRFYLRKMQVRNGRLIYRDFAFKTIVLPDIEILTLEVARKLVDFAKSGGIVVALGPLPGASAENGMDDPKMISLMNALRSCATFSTSSAGLKPLLDSQSPGLMSRVQFVSGEFPMLQLHRRIDGRDFFWLVNNHDQTQLCELEISGTSGAASVWDCETGEIRPVGSRTSGERTIIKLKFKPLEGFWLVFDPESPEETGVEKPEPQIIMTLDGGWNMRMDPAQQPAELAGSVKNPSVIELTGKPLGDWKSFAPGGEKFSGIWEYTRMVDLKVPEKNLFLDLGKVCHVADVWINGQSAGSRMWGPYRFNISGLVKAGPNEVRIRVANLINNSIGDFQESGLMGPVNILVSN